MEFEEFARPARTPIDDLFEEFLRPARKPIDPACQTASPAVGLSTRALRWATRIRAELHKSFASTIEVGRLLIEAKDDLDHGEWLPTLERAGLNARSAQLLMRLARHPRFANASPDSLLPACPSTLDRISKLPEDVYQRLLANGSIHLVSRRGIAAILRKLQQAADKERILNLRPVPGRFRTLIIDPGWRSGGGWGCPYATMSQQELLDLPITEWLLDQAHVYLWTTTAEMGNAVALFKRWGIPHDDTLVWHKTHPNGTSRMGMGHHFRRTCEFVLFGVRGKLRTREAARSIGTVFSAPVTGAHSEKPDEFYRLVELCSYPPFGELFQRKPREGFVSLFAESAVATKTAA